MKKILKKIEIKGQSVWNKIQDVMQDRAGEDYVDVGVKNRMILGITCIVISLIIYFAITPLINVGLSKKTTVVRVNREIKAGEQLTKNMLTEVEVGNYNLPANVYHSIDEVNGMYVTADMVVGDYLFPAKLSEDAGKENTYLYNLNGEKQAISITIDKFARGLSGKLKSGDVVSVIAPDYMGSRETVIPQELQYVEVIAVTAKSGYDANMETGEDTEEKELPSTVTLLVRPEQAKILAQLEAEGNIHLSLVYRGTTENAAKFIAAQDTILNELKAAEEAENEEGSTEEEAEQENSSPKEISEEE